MAFKNRPSLKVDIFLLLILAGLFFILLGVKPLFVPDEGRYAEIAREMAVTGDYITPYLNGIKYFEKPALFYWLGALAYKVGGVNLWSIRSVNAVLALLGCLITYGTVRKLYDQLTGLFASLILATSALYFIMAHMVSLDLPVTVFLMASLYSFLLGITSPTLPRVYFWGAAAFAGCAVLTKGLIGVVFPIAIVSCWLLATSNLGLLKRLPIFSSLTIFFAITLPWHFLVASRNPEFFHFYFIEQHFLRYTLKEVGHYQPVWFFIPNLMLAFFPWIVFLPQALWSLFPNILKWRKQYQIEIFLLLWAVLVFTFFSFSKSKLIPYILPVLPPLAILTARYMAQKNSPGIKTGFLGFILFSLILGSVFIWFTQKTVLPNPLPAKIYFSLAAAFLIVGSLISFFYSYRNKVKAIFIAFGATAFFLLTLLAGFPSADTRTILPLAKVLNPILQPQDEVITFNQYYQDLPFYLERRVSILNWRNELSYGMQHQDTREWMIDDATFWQRFHSSKRVYVVLSKTEFQQLQQNNPQEKFHVLATTINNILMTNQPPHEKDRQAISTTTANVTGYGLALMQGRRP